MWSRHRWTLGEISLQFACLTGLYAHKYRPVRKETTVYADNIKMYLIEIG
jgi:hypothetical protein